VPVTAMFGTCHCTNFTGKFKMTHSYSYTKTVCVNTISLFTIFKKKTLTVSHLTNIYHHTNLQASTSNVCTIAMLVLMITEHLKVSRWGGSTMACHQVASKALMSVTLSEERHISVLQFQRRNSS